LVGLKSIFSGCVGERAEVGSGVVLLDLLLSSDDSIHHFALFSLFEVINDVFYSFIFVLLGIADMFIEDAPDGPVFPAEIQMVDVPEVRKSILLNVVVVVGTY